MQRHSDQAQQTKRNPNIQLLSPWSNTENEKHQKYLGIDISSDLSWSNHVEDVAARGNRTTGFLRRKRVYPMHKVKSSSYTTIGVHLISLGSAQAKGSRAARCVNNSYTDRSPGSVTSILENLKWTSLEHRRQQICLKMLYKINKGLTGFNPESFFSHSDPRTRGAQRLHQGQIQHPSLFTLSSPVQCLSGTTSEPLSPRPFH